MDEKTFFEYEDVKVTSARFISGSQTYAMSNVTSVKASEFKPSRIGGVLLLLLGILLAFNTPMVGLPVIAGAAYYLYQQKTTFHVMLATAGGEVSALKTYQREYLNKVVGALNDAIVHRG